LKFWLTYLVLALRNLPMKKRIVFPAQNVGSSMWASLNSWLQFQIRWVSANDWLRSPLMVQVAGGYSEENNLKGIVLDVSDKKCANELASKYAKSFNGYQSTNYENWLLKVIYLIRSAELIAGKKLITKELTILEIGPGVGPLIGLALQNGVQEFVSYDTVEMQFIQRYTIKSLEIDNSKVQYVAINEYRENRQFLPPKLPYVLFGFWSFSEIQKEERKDYLALIKNAAVTIIACNKNIEGLDNFNYLESLARSMNKTCKFLEFKEIFGLGLQKYQEGHRLYCLQ